MRLNKFALVEIHNILIICIVFTFLVSSPAAALEKCGSGARVTCVVDGDTIWFEGEKIRMIAYDTPEPTTNMCGGQKERALALRASNRLVELLNQGEFTIDRFGLDKFGRRLAIVKVGGVDVGDILIREGLARRWPDGPEFWCR